MPFFLLFIAFTRKRKWLVAIPLLIGTTVSAADKYIVELDNGHQVVGSIHEEDDQPESHVWILREEPGIRVVSGFPRDRIKSMKPYDKPIIEQLPLPSVQSSISENSNVTSDNVHFTSVVQNIDITAVVTSWDNDSFADGIEVFVRPIGNNGQVVETKGTIDFQLLGQRTAWRTSKQLDYFRDFALITTWTKRLQDGVLTPNGYRFRLEFRNTHPDYDLNLELEAMVQARLNLIGQPVLEANSGPVLLRGFSVLRDDRQQFTGNRFFPEEHAPGF